MRTETIKERTVSYLKESQIPVTVFCRAIDLSRTSLYQFLNGELRLKDTTLDRIDKYLQNWNR